MRSGCATFPAASAMRALNACHPLTAMPESPSRSSATIATAFAACSAALRTTSARAIRGDCRPSNGAQRSSTDDMRMPTLSGGVISTRAAPTSVGAACEVSMRLPMSGAR